MNIFLIILETGDVQRHRALCEYIAIKNVVLIFIFIVAFCGTVIIMTFHNGF